MADPLLSVLIPTHNRSDALALTLAGLAAQECSVAWEVVVVNNCCTDDTDQVVAEAQFPVPLRLVHEAIAGAGRARNAAAAAARGEFILFLDNDILAQPGFLQGHYDALTGNPACWIVGQLVNLPEQELTPFGRFRRSLFEYDSPETPPREARGLTAQNLSMPRSDFEQLGGFDETYGVASVEDLDLAMRARQRGIRILYVPALLGVHNDWAGFTIRDYCERQRSYTRSEPLFEGKWGDAYPRPEIRRENVPPQWATDPPSLWARKHLKRLMNWKPVSAVLFGFCAVLEKVCPWRPVLWRLYRLLLGCAIYRGYQEGLRAATEGPGTGRRKPEPGG